MNKEEKNSNKCPICGRPTHKESEYCIFHASKEEKTEEEFKGALTKEIIKNKLNDLDDDFFKFIFIGSIYFKEDFGLSIFKNADFRKAIFEGNVFFDNTVFKENTYFNFATFKGYVDFGNTNFEKEISFMCTKFEEYANFNGAIFGGKVDFLFTNFKKDADFVDVTFKNKVDFGSAHFNEDAFIVGATFENAIFEEYVNFTHAIFEERVIFTNTAFGVFTEFDDVTFKNYAYFLFANFKKGADFQDTNFEKNVHFDFATFPPGKTLSFKIKNNIIISFIHTIFENIFLIFELEKNVFIDFTHTMLRNTHIKMKEINGHILQEKERKFSEAKEIYLLLKNNFHSIGRYEDESRAFTKERDMERMSKSFYSLLNKYKKYSLFKKILKQSNLLKRVTIKSKIFRKWLFSKKSINWINLSFSDFIYQYGENPWRVIRFALIIIFLFAVILNFSGIVYSDRTNLLIEIIKENQGGEYTLRYLGPILGNFLDCLYFSVVTFTTLGYGDFQPAVGYSRIFVSLESIIGAFTMALFVYTFARRTGGR